jgi:hypothetical protein
VLISELYLMGGKGDHGEGKAKEWVEKQGDFATKLDADTTVGSARGTTD